MRIHKINTSLNHQFKPPLAARTSFILSNNLNPLESKPHCSSQLMHTQLPHTEFGETLISVIAALGQRGDDHDERLRKN